MLRERETDRRSVLERKREKKDNNPYICVGVCEKALAHAWTGALPIHRHYPGILSTCPSSRCFPASCFYCNRKLRSGRWDSLVPLPRPYLPCCDLTGRFGLRLYELHGEIADVDRAELSGRRGQCF